jgi:hypothetical protein
VKEFDPAHMCSIEKKRRKKKKKAQPKLGLPHPNKMG